MMMEVCSDEMEGAPSTKLPQSGLSFAAVQGQSRLLLDRLQLLGDGAREAAGRRDRAQAARLAEANEMRAQHASLIIGRNIRRSGFGLLD